MTEQEIFDTVLTHLRKQGKAATDLGGARRYRGADGTACAVGCLIPDELYDPLIEGLGVAHSVEAVGPKYPRDKAQALSIFARIKNHLGTGHIPLLHELQGAHDIALFDSGLDAWEKEMHQIARAFDLKYTPV